MPVGRGLVRHCWVGHQLLGLAVKVVEDFVAEDPERMPEASPDRAGNGAELLRTFLWGDRRLPRQLPIQGRMGDGLTAGADVIGGGCRSVGGVRWSV